MIQNPKHSPPSEAEPKGQHRKKKPKHKKFGIQEWSRWFKKWVHSHWYVTEKARDQAYEVVMKANERLKLHDMDSPIRKVNR